MKEHIHLTVGEDRTLRTSTTKTYFFYVSDSGLESAIHKCKELKLVYTNNSGTFAGLGSVSEYEVVESCKIKMFTMCSKFGKPREVYEIWIKVHPEAELISVKGINGFGEFRGRGIVLGYIGEKGLTKGIPEAMKYEIIQPPKKILEGSHSMFSRKIIS